MKYMFFYHETSGMTCTVAMYNTDESKTEDEQYKADMTEASKSLGVPMSELRMLDDEEFNARSYEMRMKRISPNALTEQDQIDQQSSKADAINRLVESGVMSKADAQLLF